MKNYFKVALLSLLMMASCSKYEELAPLTQDSATFYASIESPSTRTYTDENGKLLWTENDKITIFKGNTIPFIYQFTGSTGDNYGGFNDITTSLGGFDTYNELSATYAIYPYSASTTITDAGVINYTIPATQTYAENSFGLGANVMVAVTADKQDNFLAFKNLGGYFEFSLYGEDITVARIDFCGNNGEKLAGKITITATHNGTPVVAYADDATTTLTLDCGDGIELSNDEENPTKFWFVVPAMTYEEGITITITDTEGKIMEKSTANEITIERSTVQPLMAFEVETAPIPNNQIWYTSRDGEIITPYSTDVFGANIVSNTYKNGKGVITFDDDVTSIGNSAFNECYSLTSIIIPNGVTLIGDNAFTWCHTLSSITLPDSITSIGASVFTFCRFTSITLPDSLTSIGNGAFNYCYSLKNITIPNGVTSIGNSAFYDCNSLTSITLPDSITSIGNSAFNDCYSLTSITLPDSITSIGNSAFDNCHSLTSITLPDSIAVIGNRAFYDCYSITTVYSKKTTPPLAGDYVFLGCDSLTKIYVPTDSDDAYKVALGWTNYAAIIEGYNFNE